MTYGLILSFFIIVLVGTIIPGPNGLLIVSNSIAYGKKTALITLSGTVCAFYVHGIFSVLGISAIVVQSAKLFTIVKFCGLVYLGYLGLNYIIQSFRNINEQQEIEIKIIKETKSNFNAWSQGFITNLLNPKVSIFYLAIFPQFFNSDINLITNTALLVTIQALVVSIWFSIIAILAVKIRRNQNSIILRILKGFIGSLMLWFGFKLSQT